ncbi:hypothetical protein SAMN05216419_10253 [Nitrosomonas cryotolerans]|uniref:Uncharacterized protein n=1 Tax=Nitrosomonas cryotolerans ATCC 49181 TaxID=1131553 RepID=A0A1N6IW39_9PROT|nr:hypothetical protein [Nitrosomonas cryotolerans]SFP85366.1 hypothetical protein SAMN05216419_10253 [Nitrosomonas cryotolerans]SIO36253.1 hypothetical protein SAMN02743940_2125 [Nitrosomonas cryotolerans ATCC 49181]
MHSFLIAMSVEMEKDYDDYIGSEAILPIEIIDLLAHYKTVSKDQFQKNTVIDDAQLLLDEHELAMIE